MKLVDYLQPRLFEPLGIRQVRWDENPRGFNLGFSGLHVTTETIAKFGQLYLQKGRWQGKQLLSETWVETATREHIPCGFPGPGGEAIPDWEQGYGYQFWRCQHGCYRADGAFGQFCVVMPKQDAVLAITSAVENMQDVLDLTWTHLLPGITDAARADDAVSQRAFSNQLTNLAISPVKGETTSPLLQAVSGQTYQLEPTPEERLRTVKLHFREKDCLLTVSDDKQEHQMSCAYNGWLTGTTTFYTPVNNFHTAPVNIEASGAWTDPNTFTIKVIYTETPHCLTVSCQFDENRLAFKRRWNVSFGPLELPVLTGNK
jgi:hypothetical protein